MAQRRIADSAVQELLTVGPFLGIDASTSKYFLDQYHGTDSIAMVPNRAFQGYVTSRGRVHALSAAYASALFGLTKFQRAGLPDLYLAATNGATAGELQQAQLGAAPSTLALPAGTTLGKSLETSFVPYQQWLFETNGNDTPLKIDTNLTVSRWQMAAPASGPTLQTFPAPASPTLALVAGASNAAAVYACCTYVDANGNESHCNNTPTTLTPSATQQVQVTSPVAQAGAASYNVYVGTGAAGPYYLQNAAPIALGTAYTIPGTPSTSGRASTAWAGSLRGYYSYLVTFANGSQESSPNTTPSTLNYSGDVDFNGILYHNPQIWFTNQSGDFNLYPVVTSGPVLLTNVPTSSDPQCTGRNIYRFGGTMQEIMLVGTINDNTTTTFVDNTADGNVTGTTLVPHRDAPQPFFAIEAHKGRVWGFGYNGTAVGEPTTIQGTSDLWYSNYEEPWAFNNVNQVIPIGRNAGSDVAVALKSVGSLLCCLKSKSFWAIYGDTPQDFVRRHLAPIGCGSKKSVVSAYGRLFWLSDEGAVYMFDGASFTNISDNRTTGANSSIKGILDGFTAADFAACAGAAYDNTYMCSFPTQNITFMYDIPTGQWFKLPWAFDRATFDLENQNEMQASEVGSGTLDTWFAAETDLGSAITSSHISRISDSGAPQATKRYRYAVVLAPVQAGATATVTVTGDPGGTQRVATRSVNLGSSPPSHKVSLPPNMLGSEVQVTIAVSSTSRTELHRVSLYGWVERQFVSQG